VSSNKLRAEDKNEFGMREMMSARKIINNCNGRVILNFASSQLRTNETTVVGEDQNVINNVTVELSVKTRCS
jgi:hypothetical protein